MIKEQDATPWRFREEISRRNRQRQFEFQQRKAGKNRNQQADNDDVLAASVSEKQRKLKATEEATKKFAERIHRMRTQLENMEEELARQLARMHPDDRRVALGAAVDGRAEHVKPAPRSPSERTGGLEPWGSGSNAGSPLSQHEAWPLVDDSAYLSQYAGHGLSREPLSAPQTFDVGKGTFNHGEPNGSRRQQPHKPPATGALQVRNRENSRPVRDSARGIESSRVSEEDVHSKITVLREEQERVAQNEQNREGPPPAEIHMRSIGGGGAEEANAHNRILAMREEQEEIAHRVENHHRLSQLRADQEFVAQHEQNRSGPPPVEIHTRSIGAGGENGANSHNRILAMRDEQEKIAHRVENHRRLEGIRHEQEEVAHCVDNHHRLEKLREDQEFVAQHEQHRSSPPPSDIHMRSIGAGGADEANAHNRIASLRDEQEKIAQHEQNREGPPPVEVHMRSIGGGGADEANAHNRIASLRAEQEKVAQHEQNREGPPPVEFNVHAIGSEVADGRKQAQASDLQESSDVENLEAVQSGEKDDGDGDGDGDGCKSQGLREASEVEEMDEVEGDGGESLLQLLLARVPSWPVSEQDAAVLRLTNRTHAAGVDTADSIDGNDDFESRCTSASTQVTVGEDRRGEASDAAIVANHADDLQDGLTVDRYEDDVWTPSEYRTERSHLDDLWQSLQRQQEDLEDQLRVSARAMRLWLRVLC